MKKTILLALMGLFICLTSPDVLAHEEPTEITDNRNSAATYQNTSTISEMTESKPVNPNLGNPYQYCCAPVVGIGTYGCFEGDVIQEREDCGKFTAVSSFIVPIASCILNVVCLGSASTAIFFSEPTVIANMISCIPAAYQTCSFCCYKIAIDTDRGDFVAEADHARRNFQLENCLIATEAFASDFMERDCVPCCRHYTISATESFMGPSKPREHSPLLGTVKKQ